MDETTLLEFNSIFLSSCLNLQEIVTFYSLSSAQIIGDIRMYQIILSFAVTHLRNLLQQCINFNGRKRTKPPQVGWKMMEILWEKLERAKVLLSKLLVDSRVDLR